MTVNPFSTLSGMRSLRMQRTMDIIRRYTQGEPVQEIADRYGLGKNQVLIVARNAGLPKRVKHFPEKIRNAVIRDYKKGLAVKDIAANYAVSEAYVSKVAKDAGISRYKSKNSV